MSAADGEAAPAQTVLPDGDRPLACVLGWVGVKERHLRKYTSLYTSRGIDVLALLSTPAHVAMPLARGRASAGRIAEALGSSGNEARPLLVHGFSVGAYMYGNLLIELGLRGGAGAAVAHRIRGLAFDSAVDYNGVPFGLSRAIAGAEGTLLQRSVHAGLDLFLSPALPFRQHLVASSVAMHGTRLGEFSSPLRVPSTFLYGPDDSVTDCQQLEAFCREWRAAGVEPVEEVVLPGSPHVSHLSAHPEAYDAAIGRLVDRALGSQPYAPGA